MTMKNIYENPVLDVTRFETADIITSSPDKLPTIDIPSGNN